MTESHRSGQVNADVLIIGGGVIGLSIAWRAAQRGMRVAIADPDPGRGASYAAAGMLTPVAEAAYAERALFELGSASLREYPSFAAELAEVAGLPVGFRQTGTLLVGYDADDMAMIAEHATLREDFGVPSERLTGRECRKTEPLLGPAIGGGLLVPDDASIDPRLLTSALLAALVKADVTCVRQLAARLLIHDGKAAGAELADGSTVGSGQVVIAAGWASARLTGLPPEAVPPVRPVKGQILRLGPSPATLSSGLPPSLLTMTVRGIVQGSSVYLVPREDGELVIGATQEELGQDTAVTAGGIWQLLRDARAIVPGITELEFAEAVARLRPGTPDNAPVIGPSALPGLVLATGHFRSGVLLAPVTADLIASYLQTGSLATGATPFLAQRFASPATIPSAAGMASTVPPTASTVPPTAGTATSGPSAPGTAAAGLADREQSWK
ncbi:MAG TPA: glycine oxidase ThiO [Streptosporangiaceae bacterium]|nr:glycine oxidase ThiO [Streptosporangiaceae bacterium]